MSQDLSKIYSTWHNEDALKKIHLTTDTTEFNGDEKYKSGTMIIDIFENLAAVKKFLTAVKPDLTAVKDQLISDRNTCNCCNNAVISNPIVQVNTSYGPYNLPHMVLYPQKDLIIDSTTKEIIGVTQINMQKVRLVLIELLNKLNKCKNPFVILTQEPYCIYAPKRQNNSHRKI